MVGGGIDEVPAILVPEGCPVDPLVVVREGLFAGAVGIDDVKLKVVFLFAVAAEDDLFAIG